MDKRMTMRRRVAVAAVGVVLAAPTAFAQVERPAPVPAPVKVIAPPKPAVETVVMPGLLEKGELQRNAGVLRARSRNPANLPGGPNPKGNPVGDVRGGPTAINE